MTPGLTPVKRTGCAVGSNPFGLTRPGGAVALVTGGGGGDGFRSSVAGLLREKKEEKLCEFRADWSGAGSGSVAARNEDPSRDVGGGGGGGDERPGIGLGRVGEAGGEEGEGEGGEEVARATWVWKSPQSVLPLVSWWRRSGKLGHESALASRMRRVASGSPSCRCTTGWNGSAIALVSAGGDDSACEAEYGACKSIRLESRRGGENPPGPGPGPEPLGLGGWANEVADGPAPDREERLLCGGRVAASWWWWWWWW